MSQVIHQTNTKSLTQWLYILPMVALIIIGSLIAMGYLYNTPSTNATSEGEGMSFIVQNNASLDITMPAQTVLSITPSYSGSFNSEAVTVLVDTDNTYGYNLVMTTTTTTDLVGATPLSGGDYPVISTLDDDNGGSGYICTPETANDATCTFPVNRWGYKLSSGNYLPMTNSVSVRTTDGSANMSDAARTNVVTFGAKLNNATSSGNYSITLNFIATTNAPSNLTDFDAAFIFAGKTKYNGTNYYAMQDMNSNICSYVATPAASNTTSYPTINLIDTRDNEVYVVGKLADGNCWLLDNLRLGSNSPIALTPADTNIVSNWTLPASGTACFTESENCDNSGDNAHTGYTVPAINTTSATVDAIYRSDYINNIGKTGGFYNYCAVTAGTICSPKNENTEDAVHDICPINWKLPNGASITGNYYNLYVNSYATNIASFTNALRTPIIGTYYSGYIVHSGGYSSFWSSTHYNGSAIYSLYVGTNDFNTQNNFNRFDGTSTRCVVKKTISDVTYMQEFATMDATDKQDVLNSMVTGQAYTLLDNRDNEEYNVAKLADGNVWLLDNLRLDPATLLQQLTPANTNMDPSTLFTLPESISTNFNSYTEPNINTDYKDTTDANGWKYGVYYNYCATSAGTYCYDADSGTGDAEYDICPAGWRLPTSVANNGDFQKLLSVIDVSQPYHTTLHMPMSGSYYQQSTSYIDENNMEWSATYARESAMIKPVFRTDNTHNLRTTTTRDGGVSVRCILK